MPTPTDERPDLLTVIAHMRARPGQEDRLRSALEALVEPTSREPGYVNYDLHESVDQPGHFFFTRTGSPASTSTRTCRPRISWSSPTRWGTCSTSRA